MTKPKWTYDDFYKKIVDQESRIKKLENQLVNRELESAQHRKALSELVTVIERALTESPFPFLKEQRREWANGAKKPNLWKEVRETPY